jgi:hypothetical protein
MMQQNAFRTRGIAMSDQDDWDFAAADDAKAEIRAAVSYLLKDVTGSTARDLIALEIMEIVRRVANGLPAEPSSPLDDGMPGG